MRGWGPRRKAKAPPRRPRRDCREEVMRLYDIGGAAWRSGVRCAGHGVATNESHSGRSNNRQPHRTPAHRLKMFIHDTQAGEHTSRRHVPREGRRRGQHHGWRYLVDPSHEEGATRSVAANRTMNAEGRTTSCAARSTAQGRRRDQHHVWRYLVEHVHVGRAARSSGNSVGTRGIDSKEGATRVIAQSAQGSLRRATGQPQGSHRP